MVPTLVFEILRFKLRRALPSLRAVFALTNQMREDRNVDFVKLTGTGSNEYGFSILPDLRQYVVFSIWRDALELKRYTACGGILALSKIDGEYERFAVYPTSAQGFWDGYALDLKKKSKESLAPNYPQTLGGCPMAKRDEEEGGKQDSYCHGGEDAAAGCDGRIVVLTRASIRWQRLLRFWQAVPSVTRSLSGSRGLIRSVGFGEYPLIRQATFSIWENRQSMVEFAYGGRHQEIIKRTHAERWYREEMFVEGKLVPELSSKA